MDTDDTREQLIRDNIRLVSYFVRKFVHGRVIRLFGGYRELVADLYQPYVQSVDNWLASSGDSRLSVFAFNRMKWFLWREYSYRTLIHVPDCAVADDRLSAWKSLLRKIDVELFSDVMPEKLENALAVVTDNSVVAEWDARTSVLSAMRTLHKRQQEVISMRFGIDRDTTDCVSYKKIGKILGISAEYVRQVEARALIKLRKYFERLGELPRAPQELRESTFNPTEHLRNIRIWSVANAKTQAS